jgi:hypothetical protein
MKTDVDRSTITANQRIDHAGVLAPCRGRRRLAVAYGMICLLYVVILISACHPRAGVNYEQWLSRYKDAIPYTDGNSFDSTEAAAFVKQARLDELLGSMICVEIDSPMDSSTISVSTPEISVLAVDSQYVYLRVPPRVRSFLPDARRNADSLSREYYELWIYDRSTRGQRATAPLPATP